MQRIYKIKIKKHSIVDRQLILEKQHKAKPKGKQLTL
jgi:hypothetical protein